MSSIPTTLTDIAARLHTVIAAASATYAKRLGDYGPEIAEPFALVVEDLGALVRGMRTGTATDANANLAVLKSVNHTLRCHNMAVVWEATEIAPRIAEIAATR